MTDLEDALAVIDRLNACHGCLNSADPDDQATVERLRAALTAPGREGLREGIAAWFRDNGTCFTYDDAERHAGLPDELADDIVRSLPALAAPAPALLPCGHDPAQQWWGKCRACAALAAAPAPDGLICSGCGHRPHAERCTFPFTNDLEGSLRPCGHAPTEFTQPEAQK